MGGKTEPVRRNNCPIIAEGKRRADGTSDKTTQREGSGPGKIYNVTTHTHTDIHACRHTLTRTHTHRHTHTLLLHAI